MMGKYFGLLAVFTGWGIFIAGWVGWVLNLFHCLAYIGGGNASDSTAETVIRIVGIFTWLPGAIAGWM